MVVTGSGILRPDYIGIAGREGSAGRVGRSTGSSAAAAAVDFALAFLAARLQGAVPRRIVDPHAD
jgi:hypothetical protein